MEPREAEVWGKCFVLVMVWACGAHMDARQRECFDARLRGLVRRVPSMAEFPLHSASTIWDGEAEIGDTTAVNARHNDRVIDFDTGNRTHASRTRLDVLYMHMLLLVVGMYDDRG